MFFLKAAFWIVVILLLLPTDGQDRYALYTAAQRTISDIGGFCARNPEVCDMVSSAADNVGRKLQTATDSIEDMLRDAGIGVERSAPLDSDPAYHDRHGAARSGDRTTTSSVPGDTLTPMDRAHAWNGPGKL